MSDKKQDTPDEKKELTLEEIMELNKKKKEKQKKERLEANKTVLKSYRIK